MSGPVDPVDGARRTAQGGVCSCAAPCSGGLQPLARGASPVVAEILRERGHLPTHSQGFALPSRAFHLSAVTAVAAVVTVTGAAPAVSHAASPSSGSLASGATAVSRADFDADGYPDVAVAAPGGTINGRAEAGYIAVVYGMAEGPNGVKHQLISQNRYGIPGTAETGDRFGSHLTAADLDGDGFTDLVVGAPGEDVDGARDVGRHTVLWKRGRARHRHRPRPGDVADPRGRLRRRRAPRPGHGPSRPLRALQPYGWSRPHRPARRPRLRVDAMEAGDVDGDGMTDLVVSSGSPARDGLTVPLQRLRLLRGTERGLVAGPSIAPADTVSADSIALGDVDGDGRQDVVFGRSTAGGGLLGVVRGTADGLEARATLVGQDSPVLYGRER
ncbi:FG-GAP-like repeat-containing protein [Streptomyces hirsutus]